MFTRSRIIIVALAVLVSFTFVDTRRAGAVVDPFSLSVAVSALIHAAIIGGAYLGWRTYKKENGGARNPSGTKVTPNGTIGRDVKVDWVDLTKTDFIDGKDATAKVPYGELKSAVKADPGRFPRLKNAITKTYPGQTTGDVVEATNGKRYKLGSKGATACSDSPDPLYTYKASNLTVLIPEESSAVCPGKTEARWYGATEVQDPPSVIGDASPQEFAKRLSGVDNAPANVYSDFYAEIDDYLTGKGGTLSVVDTPDSAFVDSAPPLSVPSMPTPAQFNSAKTGQSATAAASAALSSAQGAVTAAQGSVNSAQQAYNSSGSASDLQKLNDALKGLADANAALDRLKADLARQAADDARADADDESDQPAVLGEPGEVPDLNFGRFQELKGALSSTYPFSLISMLPDLLSPFSRSPSAPVIHLPVYGNDLVVDLSIFDPVAAVCRWCLGVLATAGVVYYVVHFWRGVS